MFFSYLSEEHRAWWLFPDRLEEPPEHLDPRSLYGRFFSVSGFLLVLPLHHEMCNPFPYKRSEFRSSSLGSSLFKLFGDRTGQIIDHIIYRTLHSTACSFHMAASAEIGSHRININISIRAKAYFKLLGFYFRDKDRHFNTSGHTELLDDTVQILGLHTIEFQVSLSHISYDHFSIHDQNALHQTSAQNLVLNIAFLIKRLIDDPGKVYPHFHQLCSDPHSLR